LSGDLGAEIYRLLKSPIRREIILLLHSRGELTATQLKRRLNVSYGTLYYHLDFLKPLIDQVGRGKYALNSRGARIAERLLEELGVRKELKERPSILAFFEKVAASPIYYAPIGFFAAGLYLAASTLLPVKPVILFLTFSSDRGIYSPILSLLITLAYFMAIGKFLGKGEEGFGGLSAICLTSYIPVDIYLLLILASYNLGLRFDALSSIFKTLFIAAHVVQLIILAAGLTYSRGISWEKSLPIALFLSYISLLSSSLQVF